MPSRLELGIKKRVVNAHLKPAAIGRDKGNTLNFRFNMIQQFVCQAHGPVGKVSDSAVNDRNFNHNANSSYNFQKLYCFLHISVDFPTPILDFPPHMVIESAL